MSIELLPPTPNHPGTWHVRRNACNCHPETCCCDDWAVFDPDGKRYGTFFHKKDADIFLMLIALSNNAPQEEV